MTLHVEVHGIASDAPSVLMSSGLGGSAGSIPALQAFFAAMSPDSGMAFVVVLHLAADRESALDVVLQRSTAMPVSPSRRSRLCAPALRCPRLPIHCEHP